MLLFRTHQFDPYTRAFCEKLRSESGLEVVCLVDESREVLDVGDFPKLSASAPALAALGLHRPKGFQWRCGDYGLYLAAQAYPQVTHFWLVEYDVRIRIDAPLRDFFARFTDDEADLIAPMFGEMQPDWWWYWAMAARGAPVYGCLFPLLRVSAGLVRAGLEARRRLARSPVYRVFWPNDESFLATEAVRGGFTCRDFNDAGRVLYTAETFSFEAPVQGEVLEGRPPDGLIHHPVLFGEDYERKMRKLTRPIRRRERLQRKARLMLSRFA